MDAKFQIDLVNFIRQVVHTELDNEGILRGQWHFGVVDTVISPKRLTVFIDGSPTSQEIPCNPNVPFNPQDHIVIIYFNGNSQDKFALCKTGV